MNLTSVIKTSSDTLSLIVLINKVSVVIVISKTLKFMTTAVYKMCDDLTRYDRDTW